MAGSDNETDQPKDQTDLKAFLIKRRGGFKASITRIAGKLNAAKDPSTGLLEAWLKSIQATYKGYDNVQTELERKFPEERGETDEGSPDRIQFSSTYEELEGDLRQRLNERQSSGNVSNQSSKMILPQIPIPTYDGSLVGWLSFSRTFPELIGQKKIDQVTKLSVLIEACSKGSAAQLVSSATDYQTAWSRLENLNSSSTELQCYILDQIYDIVSPKEGDKASLQSFLTTLETNLAHLTSINIDYSTWDLLLVHHLARKLDPGSRKEMEKLRKPNETFTISQFLAFVKERIRLLGLRFKPMVTSTPKVTSNANSKKVTTMLTNTATASPTPQQPLASSSLQQQQQPTNPPSATMQQQATASQTPFASTQQSTSQQKSPRRDCIFCRKNNHSVWNCELAKALTAAQRRQKVMSSNLCLNCLSPNHQAAQCVSLHRCKTCGKQHHTLLHDATPPTSTSQVTATSVSDNSVVVLATAVIFIRHENGTYIPCRAFLDGGSTANFMTERLAFNLQLKKQQNKAMVVGINGTTSSTKYAVETSIKSRCSTYETDNVFLVSPIIVSKLPLQQLTVQDLNLPSDVILADPAFDTPAKVDVLLGSDVFYSILKGRKKQLEQGLWLIETDLGAIIAGKSSSDLLNRTSTFSAITDLTDQVKKFWEIDSLSTPVQSIEEKAAENHYNATTTRLSSGRYQVALPFNSRLNELGDSREMAKRIFLASEKRLLTNAVKYQHYQEFMCEMLDLGHMEEAAYDTASEYFMTHHLVTRMESATTKYRVVFNASKTTSTGVSLNDALLVGPVVQPDLFCHLLRWREHSVGVAADITKMYRQVMMRPEDRRYQRI